MKKDGIQTRNRKLATKAKKRRAGMHDFFKPFDSRLTAMYSSMGTAAAAAGYLNPMTQYYGQMTPSAFMTASTMAGLSSSSPSPNNNNNINNNPTTSTTTPESVMSSPSPTTSSSVLSSQGLHYPGYGGIVGGAGGGGANNAGGVVNGANPLVVDASA